MRQAGLSIILTGLLAIYVGPYHVTNKFNNNFEICGVFAEKKIQTVHDNRIKLAILRD